MPELPEVETVKIQLQKRLVGQELTAVEKLHTKSLFGDPKLVLRKKITGVKRLGKMLVLELEKNLVLAIHFKMSGQLILISGKQEERVVGGHPTADWTGKLPSTHTRVIFRFKSGDTMYFNDQRIFGWVKILKKEELLETPYLKTLGKEIWDFSDQDFFNLVSKRKRPIKTVIMQQDLISGIGNIYANEGLWEASLSPKKTARELRFKQTVKLREALIKVLREGIKYGGATASDSKYLNLYGVGGKYQEHFRVYSREGKPCFRCQTKIDKIVLGARGTYYCPKCQKITIK